MFKEKEDHPFKPGSYAWFHFANKGKEFLTPEGKKTKLEIFNEYKKNPAFLEHITKGKAKDILRMDKLGWKDGVIAE